MSPDDAAALNVLVRRAQARQAGALADLRAALPGRVDWPTLRTLARAAREAWADTVSAGDPVDRAERLAGLGRAATRLAGRGAGPLVRLLAERAALADARLAAERGHDDSASDIGPDPATAMLPRVERAERDAAAAARTLGGVRQRLGKGTTSHHRELHDGAVSLERDCVGTGRAT